MLVPGDNVEHSDAMAGDADFPAAGAGVLTMHPVEVIRDLGISKRVVFASDERGGFRGQWGGSGC